MKVIKKLDFFYTSGWLRTTSECFSIWFMEQEIDTAFDRYLFDQPIYPFDLSLLDPSIQAILRQQEHQVITKE